MQTHPHEKPGERTWAMWCHLSVLAMFLGIPFGAILGPLLVWLIKKDEFPLVDAQGKEVLNFQISLWIYGLGLGLLFFLLFIVIFVLAVVFPPFIVIAWILGILSAIMFAIMKLAGIALSVIAAVKVNNGEIYRYPFAMRFLK